MDQHPTPVSSRADALLTLSAALRQRGYSFVTVTPATHGSVNARPENFWARDMRDVFGWSRPFRRGALDPDLFHIAREAGVVGEASDAGEAFWQCNLRAATLERQIFLHSAFPTEAQEAVFFGPDTYRFADAVRLALAGRVRPIRRAVDIGCGSGAVGVMVARAYPGASVVLADINDTALALAGVNARAAGVTNTMCVNSDLFTGLTGSFDLIVANPPYLIDQAARTYRHGGGRRGEGLSLRILQAALHRLTPGGQLILYTGSAMTGGRDFLRQEAAFLLGETGWPWTYRELDPDVFGEELGRGAYVDAERIAAVLLITERPAWT
jgi:methylase of polypeptide subunit release factors